MRLRTWVGNWVSLWVVDCRNARSAGRGRALYLHSLGFHPFGGNPHGKEDQAAQPDDPGPQTLTHRSESAEREAAVRLGRSCSVGEVADDGPLVLRLQHRRRRPAFAAVRSASPHRCRLLSRPISGGAYFPLGECATGALEVVACRAVGTEQLATTREILVADASRCRTQPARDRRPWAEGRRRRPRSAAISSSV